MRFISWHYFWIDERILFTLVCKFYPLFSIILPISCKAFWSLLLRPLRLLRVCSYDLRQLLLNLIKFNYFPNFSCLTSKILQAQQASSNLARQLCYTFKAIVYFSLHFDSSLKTLLMISVKLSFNNSMSFWAECSFCRAVRGMPGLHWPRAWLMLSKARSMVSMQLRRSSKIIMPRQVCLYNLADKQNLINLLHLVARPPPTLSDPILTMAMTSPQSCRSRTTRLPGQAGQLLQTSSRHSHYNRQQIQLRQSQLRGMIESLQCRGFLSMVGALLITMGVGLMYLWGIISVYATSYYRIVTNDTNFTEFKADIVFPLQLLGQAISIPIAGRMFRRSSPRFVCMICGLVLSSTLYMSSYSGRYSTFAGMYGLMAGIVLGFIYIYPMAHCYTFYPDRKVFISGLIISASGLGTLIFAFMAYNTINPKNEDISPVIGYFGNQIAMRFPIFIRNLSVLLLALVTGGGLLLFDVPAGIKIESTKGSVQNQQLKLLLQEFEVPKEEAEEGPKNPFGSMNYEMTFISKGFDNHKMYESKEDREFWPSINKRDSQNSQPSHKGKKEEQTVDQNKNQDIENKNECPRVRDGPKQPIFWAIFLCILFSVDFGLLMSCNYKSLAKFKMDDKYLTIMGAFGAFACGLSRFLWSALLEKFSYRFLLWMLLAINSFLAFTIYYVMSIKVFYMVYIIATSICYGGFLGIFPAISAKVFGYRYGPQIYGFLFYGFPASNFVQVVLTNVIGSWFGLWFVFVASGAMSVVGLLMSNRITTIQYDWSHRIREHNERKRLMAR